MCFYAELLRDRQTDLVEVLTGPDTAGTRVPVVRHFLHTSVPGFRLPRFRV